MKAYDFIRFFFLYVAIAIIFNAYFTTAQLALGGVAIMIGWIIYIWVSYEVREARRRADPNESDYLPVHDFLEDPQVSVGDFVVYYRAYEIKLDNHSDYIPGGKVIATFIRDRKKFCSVESRYVSDGAEHLVTYDIEESRMKRKVELHEIRNFYVDASDNFRVKTLEQGIVNESDETYDAEVSSEGIDLKA